MSKGAKIVLILLVVAGLTVGTVYLVKAANKNTGQDARTTIQSAISKYIAENSEFISHSKIEGAHGTKPNFATAKALVFAKVVGQLNIDTQGMTQDNFVYPGLISLTDETAGNGLGRDKSNVLGDVLGVVTKLAPAALAFL